MKGTFNLFNHITCNLLCLACLGPVALQAHQLLKVFHHRVETTANDKRFLELGKIIMSFSGEPSVVVSNQEDQKNETRTRTFLFPQTTILDPECKQMIEAIDKHTTPYYRISFQNVSSPAAGIKLIIQYNHTKIGVTHCSLSSTSQVKNRIIITMYDKEQIKRLQTIQEPVLKTAFNDKKTGVIVDCGHGGDDSGATGFFNLKEKDVNLEVGTYVAYILDSKGYDVFLTRNQDMTLALDNRTRITDSNKHASLLISIHSNAASNPYACGIETFFFDIENYCSHDTKSSQLISALMNKRCTESKLLANNIHHSLLEHVHHKQPEIVDRCVKQSFLQVLIGSAVPSALVEVGFLTNQQEAALINNTQYKRLLAMGICDGIEKFINAHY